MRGLLLLCALCAFGNALKRVHGLKINELSKEKTEGRPVFYAVIMGGLAYRHQVSLWYGSLRKVGQWDGEAVMITDKPFCLQKTLEEAGMLGPKLHSSEQVDIFGPGQGYKGNLHMVKRPRQTDVKMMKLEKARAWLNLKVANLPQPASSIIYTDEDVIISKEVSDFITTVKELEKEKHSLALFMDMGMARGQPHTGVVVMFPSPHTENCLQAWGKKLTNVDIGSAKVSLKDKNNENEIEMENQDTGISEAESEQEKTENEEWYEMKGVDQQALARTKQCKPDAQTGDAGIKYLDRKFFMLAPLAALDKFTPRVFIHFTNTMRWDAVSGSSIQKYLRRIGAPSNLDPKGHVKASQCNAVGSIADRVRSD